MIAGAIGLVLGYFFGRWITNLGAREDRAQLRQQVADLERAVLRLGRASRRVLE